MDEAKIKICKPVPMKTSLKEELMKTTCVNTKDRLPRNNIRGTKPNFKKKSKANMNPRKPRIVNTK
jgi:hypothetical protein